MTLAMWTPNEVLTLMAGMAVLLVSTILPGILTYKRGLSKLRDDIDAARHENRTAIAGQNEKLNKIGTDVNGGKAAEIAAIRASHERELATLRDEMRIRNHDLLGKINAAELKAEHETMENKSLREQIAALKTQAAKAEEIARTLASRTTSNTPPDGLGNAGQL